MYQVNYGGFNYTSLEKNSILRSLKEEFRKIFGLYIAV
jgi:hypothetical protein